LRPVHITLSLQCGEQKRQNPQRVGEDLEAKSLHLLCDMCDELSGAVNSLGGKPGDFFDYFKFHSAKYVNYADEGFIFLRQATPPRIAASKLLIRPAIEIMFRLEAIQEQPEILYRIAARNQRKTGNGLPLPPQGQARSIIMTGPLINILGMSSRRNIRNSSQHMSWLSKRLQRLS